MDYPSEREARLILGRYPVPKQVFDHSLEVSQNCGIIGAQIRDAGLSVDLDLLRVGGLLHDIGRWKYCLDNGFSPEQDFHEYETGRLLDELGYPSFADMARRHPLGGLTAEESYALGFPGAVDLMPIMLESKVICIADKIRPGIGIVSLADKIADYRSNPRLHKRYFSKLPGLLERTVDRVTVIWAELESLGMDLSAYSNK